METLCISIHVRSEKRNELLRACRLIIDQTRKDGDCKNCKMRQHDEIENTITIEQKWTRWDAVKNYLQSDHFTVLLGAMKLLSKSYEIRINDSSQTDGLKLVESLRSGQSSKNLR